MFVDEKTINAQRRRIYVERIQRAIERIGVIDGCDAFPLATDLVKSFDFALRHHLAEWSRVELRPQLGLGTSEWFRVRGRVAEKSKLQMPRPDEEAFDILVSCWYRFLISDMPATPIRARRGPREVLTATDEEGFFDVTIGAHLELGDVAGYAVELEVGDQATVRAEKEVADVMVPGTEATHGVMVDLDGLILSHPRSTFTQVLGEIVLGNVYRHVSPLDGIADVVGGLQRGVDGRPNPVFYLSNAPRHLSKHIRASVEYADMPTGYLQLRDFDLRLRRLISDDTEMMELLLAHEIVDHYPDMSFIFVGTVRRLDDYTAMIDDLGPRFDAMLLFSDEEGREVTEQLAKMCETHDVDIFAASGEKLVEMAIENGWVDV